MPIPAWLLKLLITIAVNLGLPWLLKAFPWIPKAVIDAIEAALNEIKPVKAQLKDAKQAAIEKCVGVACAANTKGLS